MLTSQDIHKLPIGTILISRKYDMKAAANQRRIKEGFRRMKLLEYHVTGAIERGEAEPIVCVKPLPTLVYFKKFPEGDVIALMPREAYNHHSTDIMSYQRIGQHGAASIELLTELEDADRVERNSLKRELISLGYHIIEGN